MNRAFSVFAKSLLTAALAMSAIAHAADAAAPAANAAQKPDATKGQALYNTGDPSRNIAACLACHGPAGNSSVPAYPKLSAQHDSYVVKQLVNFTQPERQNPIMTPIAKAMTEQDMKNVAAYLVTQKPQPGAATSKEAVELGKRIYRAGIPEKNVPACASCHAPNAAGIPAQYPRLAGQHQDYTTGQLVNFRTGARNNSAQMTMIAKRMSDEEMKAVSDYVAGLK